MGQQRELAVFIDSVSTERRLGILKGAEEVA